MPRVDGDIVEFLKTESHKGEIAFSFNWKKPDQKIVTTIGVSFKSAEEIEKAIESDDQQDVIRNILNYVVSQTDDKFDQTEFDNLAGRSFKVVTTLEEVK